MTILYGIEGRQPSFATTTRLLTCWPSSRFSGQDQEVANGVVEVTQRDGGGSDGELKLLNCAEPRQMTVGQLVKTGRGA